MSEVKNEVVVAEFEAAVRKCTNNSFSELETMFMDFDKYFETIKESNEELNEELIEKLEEVFAELEDSCAENIQKVKDSLEAKLELLGKK